VVQHPDLQESSLRPADWVSLFRNCFPRRLLENIWTVTIGPETSR
jgi:hypothetical protein